jgi:hypothetical protein
LERKREKVSQRFSLFRERLSTCRDSVHFLQGHFFSKQERIYLFSSFSLFLALFLSSPVSI